MILKNKTAIVTGAAGGIGRAIVRCFAEQGANVWACDKEESDSFNSYCADISDQFHVIIQPMYFDLLEKNFPGGGGVDESIKKIRASKASIDILVNNAGVDGGTSGFQMVRIEDIEQIIHINFLGAMRITQKVLRLMIRQKSGSIINVSSISALYGEPAHVGYAASKGAMIAATKKLASEYGRFGIRVNAVAPGITNTIMRDKIPEDLQKRIISKTILGRIAEPEDIANVIAFLGSDMSAFITGEVIPIHGGLQY